MSDELQIEGKEYISSKRASELSGYAQDYIGQISRKGLIDARRIGGLWYVSMESLSAYKEKAASFVPTPPQRKNIADPGSLINFDGKDYISAARAAQITGYHQDYVGQLARAGTILSRQVGNRWYVEREAIEAHKQEKDALLAAVQRESVGLARAQEPQITPVVSADLSTPHFSYTSDMRDLLPRVGVEEENWEFVKEEKQMVEEQDEEAFIPIRVMPTVKKLDHTDYVKDVKSVVRVPGKTIFYGMIAAAALTIIVVLSFGFSRLHLSGMYALSSPFGKSFLNKNAFTASVGGAISAVGDFIEKLIVPELVYRRTKDF